MTTLIPLSALVKQSKPAQGAPVTYNGSTYMPETTSAITKLTAENEAQEKFLNTLLGMTQSTDFNLYDNWERRKINAYTAVKYNTPDWISHAIDMPDLDKKEDQLNSQNKMMFQAIAYYKNSQGYNVRNDKMLSMLQDGIVGPNSDPSQARTALAAAIQRSVIDTAYNKQLMQLGMPLYGDDANMRDNFWKQSDAWYHQRLKDIMATPNPDGTKNDYATAVRAISSELNGVKVPEATPEQLQAAGIQVQPQQPTSQQQPNMAQQQQMQPLIQAPQQTTPDTGGQQ